MNSKTPPEKPELEPIPVDGVRAAQIGTTVWAVGFIICLLFGKSFEKHGVKDATLICLAGVFLGLLGQIYARRRVNRLKLVSDIVNN